MLIYRVIYRSFRYKNGNKSEQFWESSFEHSAVTLEKKITFSNFLCMSELTEFQTEHIKALRTLTHLCD